MMSLADELGALRDRIRSLKAREDEIKEALTTGGANDLVGSEWRVVLSRQKSKRFDKSKLPQEIIDNPAFYVTSTNTVVRVVKLNPQAIRRDDIELVDFED